MYEGATWVSTHRSGNENNQTPLSKTNWWVELATKTGQSVTTTTTTSQSVGEWTIPFVLGTAVGTTYLDYTFDASGALTDGSTTSDGTHGTVYAAPNGDFLGGNSILYLDFISRLDDRNNSNYNHINTNDPVYEIVATAQYDDLNKSTYTVDTLITFGEYQAYLDGGTYATGTDDGSHWGNDFSKEIQNILKFPNPHDPLNPTPQQYSVFRIGFNVNDLTIQTPQRWSPVIPNRSDPYHAIPYHLCSLLSKECSQQSWHLRSRVRLRTRGMDGFCGAISMRTI